MENPGNVGVTGRRRLLESQNLDSRPVMGKFSGMCELRNKIAPWEAWIPRISRSGWTPSGATLAMVCFFLNYTAVCQGFCGWFWGKALQDMEIRFIRERGLVSRRAGPGVTTRPRDRSAAALR